MGASATPIVPLTAIVARTSRARAARVQAQAKTLHPVRIPMSKPVPSHPLPLPVPSRHHVDEDFECCRYKASSALVFLSASRAPTGNMSQYIAGNLLVFWML